MRFFPISPPTTQRDVDHFLKVSNARLGHCCAPAQTNLGSMRAHTYVARLIWVKVESVVGRQETFADLPGKITEEQNTRPDEYLL
jgi:hypothetical protein